VAVPEGLLGTLPLGLVGVLGGSVVRGGALVLAAGVLDGCGSLSTVGGE